MTSKSSSFPKALKDSFRLRRWPAALCLLLFFLNNIVGMFLFLSAKNQVDWGNSSALYILRQKQQVVIAVLGGNGGLTPLLAGLFGVLFAVQGFSWMNSRREIDFYESQPVLRRDRFFATVLSGFLLYTGISLVTFFAGAALSSGMGVMSGPLFLALVYEEFRTLVLFTGVYLTSVLAMMLCGSTLTALPAVGVLLVYEPALRLLLSLLRSAFFTTFLGLQSFGEGPDVLEKPVLSAAAYYIYGIYRYRDSAFFPLTAADAGKAVMAGFPEDARSIVFSAVLLLLAYTAFRHRKNEAAGSAVIFAPVRAGVKILLSVFAGTAAGLLCFQILGQGRRAGTLVPVFLMILLFSFLMCCVMEIIYHFDLKALLRNPAGFFVSAALSVLLFSFFYFDLSGFDRFLPEPAKVEYACIYPENSFQSWQHLAEDGSQENDLERFVRHSRSTDIEGIEKIARIGIENSRAKAADAEAATNAAAETAPEAATDAAAEAATETAANSFVVCYQMKSGKQVRRRYQIPADTDPALMDAVLGTDTYREGAFELDGYAFEEGKGAASVRSLSYVTAYDSRRVLVPAAGEEAGGRSAESAEDAGKSGAAGEEEFSDPAAVRKFTEAYRADLQRYNYTMAHGEIPAGIINLQGYLAPEDSYRVALTNGGFEGSFIEYEAYLKTYRDTYDVSQNGDYALTYPVFPEFTETIAFLKEEGLYLPALPDAESVSSMTVYRNLEENAGYRGMTQETTALTDPSEIGQVLENCVSTQSLDPLYDTSLLDSSVSLEIRLGKGYARDAARAADTYWSEVSSGYSFPAGKVPAFLNP